MTGWKDGKWWDGSSWRSADRPCGGARRYKATLAPRCRYGVPCSVCLGKWAEAQERAVDVAIDETRQWRTGLAEHFGRRAVAEYRAGRANNAAEHATVAWHHALELSDGKNKPRSQRRVADSKWTCRCGLL